jgi:hypothetical protein
MLVNYHDLQQWYEVWMFLLLEEKEREKEKKKTWLLLFMFCIHRVPSLTLSPFHFLDHFMKRAVVIWQHSKYCTLE